MLFRALKSLLVVAIAVGCSRQKEVNPESAKPLATPPKAEHSVDSRKAAGDDPASALNRLAADLAAGRTTDLPERFRREIDRFLAENVRPIDPTVRGRVAESIARFTDAAREKQPFVLASSKVEIGGPAADVIRDHYGGACRLVSAITRWPGWKQQNAGDAESLVAAVATTLANDRATMETIRDIRFENVSVSGDQAVVRVRRPGAETGQVSLRLIGGTWVPAAIADQWPDITAIPRSGSPSAAERAQQLSLLADRLDEITAALKSVSSQDDFDALADRAATVLLATAALANEGPRPVRKDEFVTVVVLGRLNDEQKDRLLLEFAAQTDSPASGLADSADRPEKDGVTITIGPVADLQAFAKRLPDVSIESVDQQKKTVTARLEGP